MRSFYSALIGGCLAEFVPVTAGVERRGTDHNGTSEYKVLLGAVAELRLLAAAQRAAIDASAVRLRRVEMQAWETAKSRRLNIGTGAQAKPRSGSSGPFMPVHAESLRGRSSSQSVERRRAGITSAMDHMWVLLCGSFVFSSLGGFALFESGCCRAKFVQLIMMKNLSNVCISTIAWWVLGWALAYGDDKDEWTLPQSNSSGILGWGLNVDMLSGDIAPSGRQGKWFFHWAFCAASIAIVGGGVAERVLWAGFAAYSLVFTSVVCPVVAGWTWGSGWLSSDVNDVNFMDFAGAGIVHVTGGVGALVGAIVVGPRRGRWEHAERFEPHSVPLVVFGTFMLWFGWYGFTCGSTLTMHSAGTGKLAAQIAMNTTISASAGAVVVGVLRYAQLKKYDVVGICNGILVGHVAVAAGCSSIDPGSAFVIGSIGGCIYVASSSLVVRLRIDDPIDAFAVHGAGGIWGVLAAAIFDWGKGFDHVHAWGGFDCLRDATTGDCLKGKGMELFIANLVEVVVVIAWTGSLSFIIFGLLRASGFFRLPDNEQDAAMMNMFANKAYADELKQTHCAHDLYTIDEVWDGSEYSSVYKPAGQTSSFFALNPNFSAKPASGHSAHFPTIMESSTVVGVRDIFLEEPVPPEKQAFDVSVPYAAATPATLPPHTPRLAQVMPSVQQTAAVPCSRGLRQHSADMLEVPSERNSLELPCSSQPMVLEAPQFASRACSC